MAKSLAETWLSRALPVRGVLIYPQSTCPWRVIDSCFLFKSRGVKSLLFMFLGPWSLFSSMQKGLPASAMQTSTCSN